MEGETKQIKNFIYNTKDQIGKGFSSIVYKGSNLASKSFVAVKVIDLKSIKTDVEKMLLGNQMKALRMINHQNIAQVFDIYQTANNVYIISELCASGDLANFYSKEGRVSQSIILQVFQGIVSGVQHFISKGIVHRDLKPSNILVKNNVPKIIDFGFCDIKGQKQQFSGIKFNVGSPLYMSPQAYKKSIYSEKSDVWALGIILYQILIGKVPFKDINYDTMIKNIASGEIFKNVQSGYLKMLLSRMLSIDVERRASVKEIIELLKQQTANIRNTISRKPSMVTHLESTQTQIQPRQHFSLKKQISDNSQFSPKKIPPITLAQNNFNKVTSTNRTSRNQNTLINSETSFQIYLTFLYRICKITRNQSSKSTFMERLHHLSLMKLKSFLYYFQKSHSLSFSEHEKISNFYKDCLNNFNLETYSNDLYFTNMCTNTQNWFSQTSSDYILFWLKVVLSQLYQQFSRIQNLETLDTSKFEAYLYLNEYYKFTIKIRGKKFEDLKGVVEYLHLREFLAQKKIMAAESIKNINAYVKTILETR